MTIYAVHNRDGAPDDQAIFVPEAFSWGGFAFTVVWALWHRMWVVAALLLALSATIALLTRYFGVDETISSLAGLAVNLIFGFEAQGLHAAALERAGYRLVGMSHGRNVDAAEFRFFHEYPRRPAPLPAGEQSRVVFLPPTSDTLGLFGNV
jgi:hypothetical protein